MDADSIRELFQEVRGTAAGVERKGDWMMFPCPLAPWTHQRGADKNPSFGVHIEDDGVSIVHCFTCKIKGPISYFLRMMERHSGDDYSHLRQEIENEESYIAPLPDWGTAQRRRAAPKLRKATPIDEDMADIYEPVSVSHPYLRRRGIVDQAAVDRMGLVIDPADSHGAERLLFPVRGLGGELYGFTGRATDDSVVPRIRDYFGLSKVALLLGAHLIDPERDRYVCLVEGLVDYAIGTQAGHPTVAAMGSDLSPEQAAILKEIGLPVYCFFDDDEAGDEGLRRVVEQLAAHIPVAVPTFPERGLDPGQLSESEWQQMIENADVCK